MNVGIVGGSLAGCAAAIALRRAGCEVSVYERSRGALEDRGAGIGMPLALLRTLIGRVQEPPAWHTVDGAAVADWWSGLMRDQHSYMTEDARRQNRS